MPYEQTPREVDLDGPQTGQIESRVLFFGYGYDPGGEESGFRIEIIERVQCCGGYKSFVMSRQTDGRNIVCFILIVFLHVLTAVLEITDPRSAQEIEKFSFVAILEETGVFDAHHHFTVVGFHTVQVDMHGVHPDTFVPIKRWEELNRYVESHRVLVAEPIQPVHVAVVQFVEHRRLLFIRVRPMGLPETVTDAVIREYVLLDFGGFPTDDVVESEVGIEDAIAVGFLSDEYCNVVEGLR